jgi:hypothetical protein
MTSKRRNASSLLELLLGAELVGVTALLLALCVVSTSCWATGCVSRRRDGRATYAVDSPRGQAGVALAADHLVAVVLGGQGLEGGLNDTTTEAEDQVKSRLLLDVVVGKGAAVLELLAGEDQALLVRGNALLVLDLGLDIVCPKSAPPFKSFLPQVIPAMRRVLCARRICVVWRLRGCAYRWCQKTRPQG